MIYYPAARAVKKKKTNVSVGERIVIRVYYSGKAHDVVTSLRRDPNDPDLFAGFRAPRNFDYVTRLAIRVDGKEVGSSDFDPPCPLRRGDEVWFTNPQ